MEEDKRNSVSVCLHLNVYQNQGQCLYGTLKGVGGRKSLSGKTMQGTDFPSYPPRYTGAKYTVPLPCGLMDSGR